MGKRTCSVEGCERRVTARGWCPKHYARWKKHGDPLRVDPNGRPPVDRKIRFWAKVDKNGPVPARCPELGPCWIWIASRSSDGYGSFDGERAHRVAWELECGPIPDGHGVFHHCDTPLCMNYEGHLWTGTQGENMADMWSKGRGVDNCGERHGMAKLTEAAVQEIRSRYAAGGSSQRILADEFGVSPVTIHSVVRGTTWRHVA